MRPFINFLLTILCLNLLSHQVFADEALDQVANPPQQKFDTEIAHLRMLYDMEFKAFEADYLEKLDELLKAETNRGNLENVIALKEERERIQNHQDPMPKATINKIALTAQNTYLQKVRAAKVKFEKGAKQAKRDLLETIDDLIKSETKAGHIELALGLRNLKKDLEPRDLPTPVESPTELEQPAANSPDPSSDVTTKPKAKITTPRPRPPLGKPIDWKHAISSPVAVKVAGFEPMPINPSLERQIFVQIPPLFTHYKSVVYAKPDGDNVGVAEISAESDGYVIVSCHFGYQGGDGVWTKTRWTADQFVANGWNRIDPRDVGGIFVRDPDRIQELFVRYVRKGENYKLRCNKYNPPYVIVFESGQEPSTPLIPKTNAAAKSKTP